MKTRVFKVTSKPIKGHDRTVLKSEIPNTKALIEEYKDMIDRSDPEIFDLVDLRTSLQELVNVAVPKKWNIFINVAGNMAFVVQKELKIKSRIEIPHVAGAQRPYVQSAYWNYVVNVFGPVAPKL